MEGCIGIAPLILNVRTREVSCQLYAPAALLPGSHSIGGWVGPRAGMGPRAGVDPRAGVGPRAVLDVLEKGNFLISAGI